MNDSDEDKHTHNQLEKILIRGEPDPPLLLFSKIYSLLGASIDVKCRQRFSERWFTVIIIIIVIIIFLIASNE